MRKVVFFPKSSFRSNPLSWFFLVMNTAYENRFGSFEGDRKTRSHYWVLLLVCAGPILAMLWQLDKVYLGLLSADAMPLTGKLIPIENCVQY